MKKVLFISLVLVMVTGLVLTGCTKSAPEAGETLELKAVHFLPGFMDISKEFVELTNKINQQTGGGMTIKVLGGPDVTPPTEMGEALRKGVIDCLMCPVEYYIPLLPEANVFHLGTLTPAEERESGFYDYMVERHKEIGMFYVGRTRAYDPFFFYLNKKVSKPEDFAGQKIGRSSPLCVPLLQDLGATVVTVQAGEFYSSLERGVVDGVGHPSDGCTGLSLPEVTDYLLDEPIYLRNSTVFLLNLDKYNSLPEKYKKIINNTTTEWENEHVQIDQTRVTNTLKIGEEAGLEFLHFSPEDSQRFFDLAYEVEWNKLEKDVPDLAPKLRELLKQ